MSPRLKSLLDQTQAHCLGASSGRPHWVLFERDVTQLADLIRAACQQQVDQYIQNCVEINSLPESVLKELFGVE